MFGGIGAFLIGLYVAMHACFIGEFLVVYFHLPIIVVAPTALAIGFVGVSSGRLMSFFQSKISIPFFVMLMLWLTSMVLFSIKGQYFPMMQYVLRYHLFPVFACALLPTVLHVQRAIRIGALGFLLALAFCFLLGQVDREGRFGIPETSLQNPNDLAFNLTMTIAFLSIFFFGKSYLLKLMATGGIIGAAYFALRTGSRANLIVLVVMVLVSLWVMKGRPRVIMVALCILTGILGVVFLPASIRARLTTLTETTSEDLNRYRNLNNALASTEARLALQQRALKLAVQNPVLGVGPGMYMYALNDLMIKQEGLAKGSWQAAHNTYLELWAENGTPAFLIYLFGVGWCVVTNYRLVRRMQGPQGNAAGLGSSFCLLLSSIAFGVGTMFCNMLYQSPYVFMIGMTAANYLTAINSSRLGPAISRLPAPLGGIMARPLPKQNFPHKKEL